MRSFLLLLFSFLSVAQLSAQTPVLFQNLYPGNSINSGVSNLYFSIVHNNYLYFNVRDSSGTSYDIYRTDGTIPGTLLLKTITQVANFHVYNNEVYFGFVDVPNGGSQLWKTDGTVAGTQLVKAFGGNAIAPNTFTVFNGMLYFVADTATTLQCRRLFISDGTAAGTHILDPNLYEAGVSYATINNKLIFSASNELDSPQKKEPYITDGTLAGTTLLKDINPGTAGSNPVGFITYNSKVYFSATTASAGYELWATDGTDAGTVMVMDLNPGTGNGIPNGLASRIYNGKLFFSGNDGSTGNELYLTDGTAAGTQLVKDIAAGAMGSNVGNIILINNKLLFACNDNVNGFELWTSDGTAAGTSLLKDINMGAGSGVYAIRAENQLCPEKLYFDADNGNNNVEPWMTDGTAAGTVALGEINTSTNIPGSLDFETVYRKLNDKVYVAAYEPTNGRELYTVVDTCNAAGIFPANSSVSFHLYPNPSRGMVSIDLGSQRDALLSVYSAIGAEVYRNISASGKLNVDLAHLSPGIYIVVLQTAKGKCTQRLTIN